MLLESATRSRNAWIEIDLDALDANVAAMRRALGSGVELIAVVKANAYGAGIEGIAPALERAGVERFAVVWLSEAVALRRLGITRPILVLGHAFAEDAEAAVYHDVTLTVHTIALGEALAAAARHAGKVARVHVKVDTGLHRFGNDLDEAVELAVALRALRGLEVEGLTTHMANADEADDSFTDVQNDLFAQASARLPWIPYRHTANSATALRRPALHYDGVRVGLALHGVLPPNTSAEGFRPILSLKARVGRVVDVPAGEGVSYGLVWRAPQRSRVALIPVGYADGYHRSLSDAGTVLIHGRRCAIVGRICMDQFLADVTPIDGVTEGDEAVLIGSQDSETITADEVADAAGTISWEVFAALQARLPRIYHRCGRVECVAGPAGSTPLTVEGFE